MPSHTEAHKVSPVDTVAIFVGIRLGFRAFLGCPSVDSCWPVSDAADAWQLLTPSTVSLEIRSRGAWHHTERTKGLQIQSAGTFISPPLYSSKLLLKAISRVFLILLLSIPVFFGLIGGDVCRMVY